MSNLTCPSPVSSNGDFTSNFSIESCASARSFASNSLLLHRQNEMASNSVQNRVPSFDQRKFKAAAAGYYDKYKARISLSDRKHHRVLNSGLTDSNREVNVSQKEEPMGPSKCVEDSAPDMCYSSRSRSSLASRSSRMNITPECSTTRSEAKEMILRVEDSIRTASEQLGSSHALVESARRELRRLKTEERKSRQDEVLQYHAAVVGEAMEAGDIEALGAVCQSAVLISAISSPYQLGVKCNRAPIFTGP
jgi:hypothetical protein